MKKRIMVLLFAVVMSAAFCMFAACDNDDNGGTTPTDNAPDPESIVGEQVTEEQWQQAFDFSDVTKMSEKITECRTYTKSNNKNITEVLFMVGGDEAYLFVKEMQYNAGEKVLDKFDESFYVRENAMEYSWGRRSKEGAQWKYYESEKFPTMDKYFPTICSKICNKFEIFTYNEQKKAYVGEYEEQGQKGEKCSILIKISNGKLCVVETEMIYNDRTDARIYQFYDYGTTKVTVPDLPRN